MNIPDCVYSALIVPHLFTVHSPLPPAHTEFAFQDPKPLGQATFRTGVGELVILIGCPASSILVAAFTAGPSSPVGPRPKHGDLGVHPWDYDIAGEI